MPLPSARGTHSRARIAHQLEQIEALEVARAAAVGLRPRQRQELIGQAHRALSGAQQLLRERTDLLRPHLTADVLGLELDRRQRCAQLMGGFGDEAPLCGERGFEPQQQVVERVRERTHLERHAFIGNRRQLPMAAGAQSQRDRVQWSKPDSNGALHRARRDQNQYQLRNQRRNQNRPRQRLALERGFRDLNRHDFAKIRGLELQCRDPHLPAVHDAVIELRPQVVGRRHPAIAGMSARPAIRPSFSAVILK